MTNDRNVAEENPGLDHYLNLIDAALASMSIEDIRHLVLEIDAELREPEPRYA
jgi:hypothetical protein